MKRILSLAVLGVSLFATSVVAQAASASATASANIISTIAISKNTDLAFGQMYSGVTAGTAVVTTAGTISSTGGVTLIASSPTAASFQVTGQPGFAYTVTLPASVTLAAGPNPPMTATNFVSNPSGASGVLSGGGGQTVLVGATLNVAANQPPANYSGSFNVTVAYN